MQSGITASSELHTAFNALVSSPTQRGLVATIRGEQLVPLTPIPSSNSDFHSDLSNLDEHIRDNEAAYILLRRWADRSDGYVAVTYVPDKAPVRSKMLFASTRLTLVRELGTERFKETPFMTTREELTKPGWEKHERHEEIGAPLTEEEQTLKGVREAEAEASMGTTQRSSHVSSHTPLQVGEEVVDALRKLRTGGDNLVQLRIAIATEVIELAGTSTTEVEGLSGAISDTDPRYSFFRFSHNQEGSEQAPIIFIYTCPTGSKIKERMVYATSRAGVVAMAIDEAGLEVVKKFEASDPLEITPAMIRDEFQPKQEQGPKQAFSRPKRPGKR